MLEKVAGSGTTDLESPPSLSLSDTLQPGRWSSCTRSAEAGLKLQSSSKVPQRENESLLGTQGLGGDLNWACAFLDEIHFMFRVSPSLSLQPLRS